MANLDVQRIVKFVSLDTHPAISALVVTYEAIVIVRDKVSRQELTRRSKRHQLQLKISALDDDEPQFKSCSGDSNRVAEIREEILQKCPILSRERHKVLEELQLNLIYLINRKQLQVSTSVGRPPSSASIRSRSIGGSATYSLKSAQTSTKLDARKPLTSAASEFGGATDSSAANRAEMYASYRCKELQTSNELFLDELTPNYLAQLNSQLNRLEQSKLQSIQLVNIEDLDAHLEGLYGESNERLEAIKYIRELANDEVKLQRAIENSGNSNLLVCALLRTLRDSQQGSENLIESILYCLVKFIGSNSFCSSKDSDNSTDLLKVCVEILDGFTRVLLAKFAQKQATNLSNGQFDKKYNSIALCLIIMEHFLASRQESAHQQSKQFIQNHSESLLAILTNFYALSTQSKGALLTSVGTENFRFLLSKIILLTHSLCAHKEFLDKFKMQKSFQLAESLISLLDSLQICSSGSATGSWPIQLVANQLFELEIDLMKLISNLLLDQRLYARLLKLKSKLLLKSVLRNLVCLLASVQKSGLDSYEQSEVLIIPLKCLYKLSCTNQVREEIYKSRIIIKCLFEYLHNTSLKLKRRLEVWLSASRSSYNNCERKHAQTNDADQIHQIILQPNQADHYIIALWLNLSARDSMPVYRGDKCEANMRESMQDYLDLSIENVDKFVKIFSSTQQNRADLELLVYLHLKLLRNFSQFLDFTHDSQLWADLLSKKMQLMTSSFIKLTQTTGALDSNWLVLPISLECLAVLTNLLAKMSAFDEVEEFDGLDNVVAHLLFNGPLLNNFDSSFNGENDDYLMVSICFLGTFARHREICNQFSSKLCNSIVKLCLFVFDSKSTDIEMVICCLYLINQLLKHSKFLHEFVARITSQNLQLKQTSESLELVDKLSSMLLHGDQSVAKLANFALDKLKQLEEQLSLSEPVASVRRFERYNGKWLQAIRANRDDLPVSSNDSGQLASCQEDCSANGHFPGELEQEEEDELGQLKVFGLNFRGRNGARKGEAETNESESEDDDDDDDCCSMYGPDSSVVDANSMIKHLTEKTRTQPIR